MTNLISSASATVPQLLCKREQIGGYSSASSDVAQRFQAGSFNEDFE